MAARPATSHFNLIKKESAFSRTDVRAVPSAAAALQRMDPCEFWSTNRLDDRE